MEGGGERHGDAVAVDGRQAHGAHQHRDDGKHHGQPLAVEPFLDIVGRAAAQLVAVAGLVDLSQGGLGKGRASTQEGNNPHPHDGSGTAIADGHGHAHDVARAHAAGKGQGKGLE